MTTTLSSPTSRRTIAPSRRPSIARYASGHSRASAASDASSSAAKPSLLEADELEERAPREVEIDAIDLPFCLETAAGLVDEGETVVGLVGDGDLYQRLGPEAQGHP